MRIEKILIIIKREYTIVTRKKLFWIVSILGPLAYLLLMVGVGAMAGGISKGQKVRIYDGAGLGPGMQEAMSREKMVVEVLPYPEGGVPTLALDNREVDAIIDIPAILKNEPAEASATEGKNPPGPQATIYTRTGGNVILREMATKSLNDQLHALWLAGRGLDPGMVKSVFGKVVGVDQKEVTAGGRTQSSSQLVGIIIILVSMMLVMMPSMIWGMELMRSIVEEKNQRIVEILISSITPFELLGGKVLGIGLVGLTQLGIWLVLAGAISAVGLNTLPPDVMLELHKAPPLHWWIFPALLLFFALAFMMYALLFAAVGSAVNTEKEAQQFVTPIMLIMMLPFMLMGLIIMAPDAPHVVIMSMIPIYSPMLLMMRLALGSLPLWQGVIGVILSLATLFGLLWASAKIFRVGILMYGQKPSLAEVIKWIGRA